MEPKLETSETDQTEQNIPDNLMIGTFSELEPYLRLREIPYDPKHKIVLDSKVRNIIMFGLIFWLVGVAILASIFLFLRIDTGRTAIICAILAIPIPIVYAFLMQSKAEGAELEYNQEKGKEIRGKLKDYPYENIIYMTALGLNELKGYYIINKSQARSSFRVSIFAIIVGFLTIVLGTGYFYLQASPNLQVTTISAISGVLLQFIGGAYFFIYRKSLEQMNSYFDQLISIQDTMLAIQLTKELQDQTKKLELTNTLVTTLLERSKNILENNPRKKPARQTTT